MDISGVNGRKDKWGGVRGFFARDWNYALKNSEAYDEHS